MELDYNKIFEVEDSANEPEVADQAEAEEITEGANEPEVAEQDVITEEPLEEPSEEESGQSAEDNSKYAAARRKAEKQRDTAIEKAREDIRAELEAEYQRKMDNQIAQMGLINPYNNQPVKSAADLSDYNKSFADDKKDVIRRKAGLSEDEMNQFIDSLPEVQKAKEQERQAEEIKIQNVVNTQLREISALDPSIKSMDDLLRMPNYQQFRQAVEKNNLSFVDAFRLVNFDRLSNESVAQSNQAARNNIYGKNHMSRTGQRGGAMAPDVPSEVMAEYKLFNPGVSEEEIRKHYAKYGEV